MAVKQSVAAWKSTQTLKKECRGGFKFARALRTHLLYQNSSDPEDNMVALYKPQAQCSPRLVVEEPRERVVSLCVVRLVAHDGGREGVLKSSQSTQTGNL